MPLIKIKLLESEKAPELQTKIDAYLTAQSLTGGIRGLALDSRKAQDGDALFLAAIAHGGLDLPATGSKIGNLQVVAVEGTGVVGAQAAVDAALADAIHKTVTDGDADAVPGSLTSATMAFEVEDVGRKITIAGSERTITARTSATVVVYSGAVITGTGLTVSMHGAEIIQPDGVVLSSFKSGDGKSKVTAVLALGGDAA